MLFSINVILNVKMTQYPKHITMELITENESVTHLKRIS